MFGPIKSRSPPKRKPFVSTTKRNATFGTPPPLPPLTPNLKEQEEEEIVVESTPEFNIPILEEDHSNHLTHFSIFQQMSIRWINMSTSLWSMVVEQSPRKNINRQSLTNFITALYWRLNGSISEDEFHCLYLEWISTKSSSSNLKTHYKCDIFILRDILIENSTTEDDLEIFLGIIIFEMNKGIIGVPLSFNSPSSSMNLELCSTRWLSLSEEFFFLLDTSGYGHLGFDDFFFLSICLLSSPQTWCKENDLDTKMSLTNVVAVTVQLMREAGSETYFDSLSRTNSEKIFPEKEGNKPTLSRRHSITYDGNGHRIIPDFSRSETFVESPSPNVITPPESTTHLPPSIGLTTLPMFKKLLIKRSIGEASLIALISYLKDCIQRLITISDSKGVDVLAHACLRDTTDHCPPKLWRTCIEIIFGYPSLNTIPTILLFLLTDGAGYLPVSFLAFPSDSSSDLTGLLSDQSCEMNNNNNNNNVMTTTLASQDSLAENDNILSNVTAKLWNLYMSWGEPSIIETNKPDFRDSIFQLISSVLSEYKSLLQLLCAAFIDISMDSDEEGIIPCPANLQASINSLLPHPQEYSTLLEAVLNKVHCNVNPYDTQKMSNQLSQIDVSKPTTLQDRNEEAHASKLDTNNNNNNNNNNNSNNQFGWNDKIVEEISHAVWATVFDYKPLVELPNFPKSISSPQNSPNRTINFVERRRKRRHKQGQSPSFYNSQGSSSFQQSSRQSSDNDDDNGDRDRDGNDDRNGSGNNSPDEKSHPKMENYSREPAVIEISKKPENTLLEQSQSNSLVNNPSLTQSSQAAEVHPETLAGDPQADSDSLPSSVVELLERGQSAGQYAQSLRDLLRKMSSNDTNLQLKSLERIIELGNTILESDDVNKSNVPTNSKKKRLLKSPKSPVPTRMSSDDFAEPLQQNNGVITAKKKVPGMVPRSTRGQGKNSNRFDR